MFRRGFLKALLGAVVATSLLVGLGASAPPSDAGRKGLDRALEVQKKHTKGLMAKKGVVGIAIGLSEDRRHVVKIYVEDEHARAGLPKKLDDVPVVVEVTGRIVAFGDTTKRYRPAPIGVSTGHPAVTAGTIAARVKKDGKVYALSNNHVYANENLATVGDNALQPGTIDGGVNPADAFGTLAEFEPLKFDGSDNTIDAAIALSSTANLGNATLPDGYGIPSSTTAAAAWRLKVKKYGRTTSLTGGFVDAINATVNVGYDSGVARFVGQIVIKPGKFSAPGDSGSLIVTKDGNHPVGLLFAGSSTITIANPIDAVLQRFGVTIDSTQPTQPTGSIKGTVTDSSTGNPIVGASVSTDSGQSGTTDAGGNYTLGDVPVGDRTVTASATGHVTQQKQTTVTDGGESQLDFALDPASTGGGTGTIKGRVTDAGTGAKLAGVLVETDTGQSARTNRGGRYTLKDVPQGVRTVTATADGYAPKSQQVNVVAGGTATADFALK